MTSSENWAELGGTEPQGLPVGAGETSPDLVLPSVGTGRPGTLAGFRGRHLLLHFFASW